MTTGQCVWNMCAGGSPVLAEQNEYIAGTTLDIMWTSLQPCDDSQICNFVVEVGCDDTMPDIRDGDPATADHNNVYNASLPDQGAYNAPLGRHETADYFNDCLARSRNGGIFTGSRTLSDNLGANVGRQDYEPDLTYGTECGEEREFFPYWEETPWKTVAVYTNEPEWCDEHYDGLECVEIPKDEYHWAVEGRRDRFFHHEWTVPEPASGSESTCVIRLRGNFTIRDPRDSERDPWTLDASDDAELAAIWVTSYNPPLFDGSTVNMRWNAQDMPTMTFQDRSHTFKVVARDDLSLIPDECNGERIHNLNVIGSKGNFDQTKFGLPHKFHPSTLRLEPGECVHIQWSGTDYDWVGMGGRGTDRTTRHNMIQPLGNDLASPMPRLWDGSDSCDTGDSEDCDFPRLFTSLNEMRLFSRAGGDPTLNDAPTRLSVVKRFNQEAVFNYMSSREPFYPFRVFSGSIIVGNPAGFEEEANGPSEVLAWTMVIVASLFAIGAVASLLLIKPDTGASAYRSTSSSTNSKATNASAYTGKTRPMSSTNNSGARLAVPGSGGRSGSRSPRRSNGSRTPRRSNGSKKSGRSSRSGKRGGSKGSKIGGRSPRRV